MSISPTVVAEAIGTFPVGSERRTRVLATVNANQGETREGALTGLLREFRTEGAGTAAADAEPVEPVKSDAERAELRAKVQSLAVVIPPEGEKRFGAGDDEPEFRAGIVPSLAEWRAVINEGVPAEGGYTVPTKVSQELRDKVRQASVFFRIAGLNVVPMDSAQLVLPTLTASNAGAKTAEKTSITEATLAFAGPALTAIKYAGLVTASNEVLADSAVNLRQRIGQIIARDIADAADTDLLSTTAVAGAIAGLFHTSKSTNTVLAAGNPVIKWDMVLDAVGRIEAANLLTGKLTILADPTAAAALRKERNAGATGDYMAGAVRDALATSAFGSDILVSPKVPAGKVVVVAGDYVTVGMRQDVQLAVSTDSMFASDSTQVRGTMRIAGVDTLDVKAVQVITPTP